MRLSFDHPLESDQREMSERRHRAMLHDAHAAVALGPLRDALPAELRPPAEPAYERRKALLEQAADPRLGTEMVIPNGAADISGLAARKAI